MTDKDHAAVAAMQHPGMTEDQFVERVGEELHGIVTQDENPWSMDRGLWGDPVFVVNRGWSVDGGPTLSQLLRAIYRVLQEAK